MTGAGMGLTLSTELQGLGALENVANVASTWTGSIILGTADPLLGADDTITPPSACERLAQAARTPAKALEFYRKGVAAGARALGRQCSSKTGSSG